MKGAAIAAIALESVPGTAGIMIPPPGYLAGVREICDRYGLSYTTGPMRKQYGNVLRKINHYALPRRAEAAAEEARTAASLAALPVRSADAPVDRQPVRLAG